MHYFSNLHQELISSSCGCEPGERPVIIVASILCSVMKISPHLLYCNNEIWKQLERAWLIARDLCEWRSASRKKFIKIWLSTLKNHRGCSLIYYGAGILRGRQVCNSLRLCGKSNCFNMLLRYRKFLLECRKEQLLSRSICSELSTVAELEGKSNVLRVAISRGRRIATFV